MVSAVQQQVWLDEKTRAGRAKGGGREVGGYNVLRSLENARTLMRVRPRRPDFWDLSHL